MARVHASPDARQVRSIDRQPMFFVATAPLGAEGWIDVSPKGMRSAFRVLGPTTVADLYLVGSGTETVAHQRENGRFTTMICTFDGPPRIVRLHGRGRVIGPGDSEYAGFAEGSGSLELGAIAPGTVVEVERVPDSCG